MTFQSLKDDYIKGLIDTNALLIKGVDETPFTKRNGQQSYLFLDHAKVAGSPAAYKAFIDAIVYLVQGAYKKEDFILCNVDSKISAQMVGSVAYLLGKPQIIYKSKELTAVEKGTQKQLTGDASWNLPVAILDDVATGGDGTAKGVADLVVSQFPGIKDIRIFVGFVREAKESTYPTHHVVTRDELLAIMWDTLTDAQRQAVEKEKTL